MNRNKGEEIERWAKWIFLLYWHFCYFKALKLLDIKLFLYIIYFILKQSYILKRSFYSIDIKMQIFQMIYSLMYIMCYMQMNIGIRQIVIYKKWLHALFNGKILPLRNKKSIRENSPWMIRQSDFTKVSHLCHSSPIFRMDS